jgi:hypothetical protein
MKSRPVEAGYGYRPISRPSKKGRLENPNLGRFMEHMNARPAVARIRSGRYGNVRFDASALLIAQTEKGRRPFHDPG